MEAPRLFNVAYPPTTAPFASWRYWSLPAVRRGCVGMREIGMRHSIVDLALCAALCVPGVVYACAPNPEPDWLRYGVMCENLVAAGVSLVADGLLAGQTVDSSNRLGLLVLDRYTALLHIVVILGLLVHRWANQYMSPSQAALALTVGACAFLSFHARIYFICVEQDWRKARRCGRLWHIAGLVAPTIALSPYF